MQFTCKCFAVAVLIFIVILFCLILFCFYTSRMFVYICETPEKRHRNTTTMNFDGFNVIF